MSARNGQAPNILYIHSHDTGRYVQPYGQQVPTPNIQLLADQGMLFRQAFCASPTCSRRRGGWSLSRRRTSTSSRACTANPDALDDDSARRYSDLRLGTEFDVVLAVSDPAPAGGGGLTQR